MKQILEMAREAGFFENAGNVYGDHVNLKAFEALVRADEREACTKVAEDSDHVVGGRGYHDQLGDADATARNIAAAIRARGNT
jgi:hypothetical protein